MRLKGTTPEAGYLTDWYVEGCIHLHQNLVDFDSAVYHRFSWDNVICSKHFWLDDSGRMRLRIGTWEGLVWWVWFSSAI